ncbi:MAG: helix-turn-helix transcriptional regulator [Chitinophagales bacterium]|nr:helix-turn-helix transcriptional regulator [Chitinophagales bacterium]
MMENINNNLYAMSDEAILQLIGNFLLETRLQQNKSQVEIAKASGINRSTVIQLEDGGGTLTSFIKVMRSLNQLEILENLKIKSEMSPLQLAKMNQQKRQRASRKSQDISTNKPNW